MRFEAVTLDCAMTLVEVDWDPGLLAVQCAAEAGCPVDPRTAQRDYNVALNSRWPEYLRLNLTGDTKACGAFWHRMLVDWTTQQGFPQKAEELEALANEKLYGSKAEVFRLYDDAIPAIEALSSLGLKLGVLSNWDYTLPRVLDRLGLGGAFDAVVPSLLVGPEKPDPRLFQHTADLLGVSGDKILHVGDHPVDDYEGALKAGWSALLLNRDAKPTEFHVIQSLCDIVPMLEEL